MPTPKTKQEFLGLLKAFAQTLNNKVHDDKGEWTIKGFINIYKEIFPITSDTKIISKILEIQLLPYFIEFAEAHQLNWEPARKQNYYPDMSFVGKEDNNIKFAVDIKTTYRLEEFPDYCNGFTLGSHGEYFIDRTSSKNIQYPYGSYVGHFTLGIIYKRKLLTYLEEAKIFAIDQLEEIPSVIGSLEFFAAEKWKIAGDKGGSYNTANIGSIEHIEDLKNANGMFSKLGEDVFDDYWMNYRKIVVPDKKTRKGNPKYITSLADFLKYKNKDEEYIKENVIIRKTDANVRKAIKKAQAELDINGNENEEEVEDENKSENETSE